MSIAPALGTAPPRARADRRSAVAAGGGWSRRFLPDGIRAQAGWPPEPGEAEPGLPVVEAEPELDRRFSPHWHVILHDDDDHTYDYVIEMLMVVFGHSLEQAYRMALEVDRSGQVIVDTTSKERAELKQEQIHRYGPDWRIPQCAGSMSATIEPAE